jgi:undecaprenyl-diphosphatase
MRRADGPLRLRHAVALGLAQGPTELLPISSSAHTTLIAGAARWGYAELDAATRKSFEVALHGGAGAGLLVALAPRVREQLPLLDTRRSAALALAALPPALAGLALRGFVERRLGGPRVMAAGLLAGAAAMAAADRGSARGKRGCEDLGALDGLALGAAQALALVPGVSRSGAALTAARARGFGRAAAESLSLATALPLLLGAGVYEAGRVLFAPRGGGRADHSSAGAGAAVAGAAAAFASTLVSARALLGRAAAGRRRARAGSGHALLPFALYRAAVAAAILVRAGRRALP